jgi:esterase/lipase
MKEEKVVFYNNKKQKLVGLLSLPDKERPPIAIIMIHGFGGYAFNEPFKDVAKNLCKNGFTVLRFAFRGYDGNSSLKDVTISGEIPTLKAAIDFIENRKINKIGLFTESLGGSIAILLNDSRIDAMFMMAPTIYFKKTFTRTMYKGIIGEKMWKEIDKINVVKESQIKSVKCPMLIVHGSNDKEVSPKQSEELFKMANEPKDFVLIKAGKHVLTRNSSSRKKIIELSLDWFNKWLK